MFNCKRVFSHAFFYKFAFFRAFTNVFFELAVEVDNCVFV